MNKKYIITLLIIGFLLVGSVLLGTSYSLWQKTSIQESTNEISVGCFTITFTNLASYGGEAAGDINLVNTYPIRDEAGDALTPYMFNIKNECEIPADYSINLETLNTSNFNTDYLRVKFNNVENVVNESKIYNNFEEGNIILTNQSSSARKMGSGHLEQNESATYSLRVWVDKAATTETPNVMGKTWNGKVVVYAEAAEPEKPNAAKKISLLLDGEDETAHNVIVKGEKDDCTYSFAYDQTEDNNLRYVGANPCNYVSFNNELWRIIGVMNNIETEDGQTQSLLKIRRAESLGEYSWDTSESLVNSGGGINEWTQADLMKELNYDYLGNIQIGTDGKWYDGINNQKTGNMPTTSLSSTAQNQIESVVWKTGAPNNNNGSALEYNDEVLKASYIYAKERSDLSGKTCISGLNLPDFCDDIVTRSSSWTGKVALMYPSDYLYATSGGEDVNRTTCLNTQQYSWNEASVSDCKNNDWLFDSLHQQWTLSPFANSRFAYSVILIHSNGSVSFHYASNDGENFQRNVRPVVFLKSSVNITGGEGTSSDPYILG